MTITLSDVNELIAQMTLEEKAALCTGASAWTTTEIERLGIPAMLVSDGPHGVRRVPDINKMADKSLPATAFPTASALASTWDTDLIHAVGQALGEECIALNVDLLLGPGANMKRSPLGGRNFEYFSEDPFLSGEMAAAFINGVQSKGVGTSLKHYAVNDQEFERNRISAEVDERTIHEIYLLPFEIAVKKAQPWSVMCAYNKINGVFASENHWLLTEVLKQEWGFEGLVVSDWGAVWERVASLRAGLDWEMPGPRERSVQAIVDAVQNGSLDEAVLDESARRILRIVLKAVATPKGGGEFDVHAHHKLARQAASEAMVLLKNNGLLPLTDPRQVAVIGHAAKSPHFQGGGSSHINPTRVDVPFTELRDRLPDAELAFAEGYPADDSFQQGMIDEAVSIAQGADVAILFIALPGFKESEGYDRPDMDLTDQQIALIKAVASAQPNTVVVLNNGSPVGMSDWYDLPAAILEGWMMGQAGGSALADILTGKVNPSGKLAETFPMKLADTPAYGLFGGGAGKVYYGEGLYIGYRYYDLKEMPVRFPFGFGLSYTTFEYGTPRVSASTFADIDGVSVSVDVTNTGKVAGKETVQFYIRDRESALARPSKELKGFAKIELQPGETGTVTVHLDQRAFAYYHPGYHRWISESGEFDILIGASAADIRASVTVTLESTDELPCILNFESTVRDWLNYERGHPVFMPFWEDLKPNINAIFGGGEDTVGMDMTRFVQDLPLFVLLKFRGSDLSGPPDRIVNELLAEVRSL